MPLFSYEDALALLARCAARRQVAGSRGRERMQEILTALGSPERDLRLIHVVGTSGKGSTAALLASTLRACGVSVGLTTSPHIASVRERIQMNGAPVSEEMFAQAIGTIWAAISSSSNPELPSYFQLVTAAAFQLFRAQGVTYAVVEAGVGGRGSVTNVKSDNASVVFTSIGLDHVRTLGNTIQDIAHEKAGMIPPRSLVFSAVQTPEAAQEIRSTAAEREARLITLSPSAISLLVMDENGIMMDVSFDAWGMSRVRLPVLGVHQAQNAALALLAARQIIERDGFVWNEQAVRDAFAALSLSGRFEIVDASVGRVVFDIAHNPQKMESLVATLHRLWPERRFAFVLAFGREAEWRKMVEIVIPVASCIVLTDFEEHFEGCAYRFADPLLVREQLKDLNVDIHVVIDDPERALALAATAKDIIVVTGYTQFVAAMRKRIAEKT